MPAWGDAAVAAVALAGAAGLLLPGRRSGPVLARLSRHPDTWRGPATGGPPARPVGAVGALGAVAALMVAAAVPVVEVVVGAVLVLAARALVRRRRDRSAVVARRAVLAELLDGLVAELRSGSGPAPALVAAAHELPGLDRVVQSAGRRTEDVAGALAELGAEAGGSTAADLAVAWRVAELTGAGLAAPVERLLDVHRTEDRLRGEVASALAGAMATAYLLSALPLAGIAMGVALGADPVGFLTRTGPGLVCLGVGVTLVLVGMRWTRSITASVMADWTGADR